MAELILGPVLRYVSDREATVWIEVDSSCEVEVLGTRTATFEVQGHHYALVLIGGLEPGEQYEYDVLLDGAVRWPEEGSDLPPSVIHTIDPSGPIEIVFGSCRVALPHTEPYTYSKDEHDEGREFDALHVLATEMIRGSREDHPDALLMLGDQVYVDEGSPRAREKIRRRGKDERPPGDEVGDFEEYTWLYHESWSDPLLRWLMSTVSCSMVWDDHDMHDDWNISREWLEEMNRHEWWRRRVVGGFVTYWLYQYAGNLSPRELRKDEVWRQIEPGSDATEILREFADRAHQTADGRRWSFCRDLGRSRIIVLEDRAGRVLEVDRRAIVDDEEWRWITEHASGDFDHLLLATTDPFLLTPAMHHIEAWNERVCDGVWGATASRAGEKLRRALDLDHWAAFGDSFRRLAELIEEVGSGQRGPAPASVVVLSGDVHHAYLAEIGFPAGSRVQSAAYQAVCSPFRNPLDAHERTLMNASLSPPLRRFAWLLARAAGALPAPIGWRFLEGPYFDNQVATLRVDGRRSTLRLDKTIAGEHDERQLECSFERRLS